MSRPLLADLLNSMIQDFGNSFVHKDWQRLWAGPGLTGLCKLDPRAGPGLTGLCELDPRAGPGLTGLYEFDPRTGPGLTGFCELDPKAGPGLTGLCESSLGYAVILPFHDFHLWGQTNLAYV